MSNCALCGKVAFINHAFKNINLYYTNSILSKYRWHTLTPCYLNKNAHLIHGGKIWMINMHTALNWFPNGAKFKL